VNYTHKNCGCKAKKIKKNKKRAKANRRKVKKFGLNISTLDTELALASFGSFIILR
jgi:uncharacterized protein with GYD domain